MLGWDCIPIKELPKNLWKVLRKKAPLQAILSIYKRKKAIWREKGIDIRKIPCGSFVYLNNKKIADDLIKTWEELGCPWSEEVVIAKYLDRVTGGWKGVDHYIEHYEPDFFQLLPQQAWMLDKIKWKTLVFQHYNRHHVSSMLQVEEAKKKKNEEN